MYKNNKKGLSHMLKVVRMVRWRPRAKAKPWFAREISANSSESRRIIIHVLVLLRKSMHGLVLVLVLVLLSKSMHGRAM